MTNQQVIDTILSEFRRERVEVPKRGSSEMLALIRAAMRIVADVESEKRQAARLASQVGFAITKGRTRL